MRRCREYDKGGKSPDSTSTYWGGRAQILQVHTGTSHLQVHTGTAHLQVHNTWSVPSPRASRLITTLVYFIVTLFSTRVFNYSCHPHTVIINHTRSHYQLTSALDGCKPHSLLPLPLSMAASQALAASRWLLVTRWLQSTLRACAPTRLDAGTRGQPLSQPITLRYDAPRIRTHSGVVYQNRLVQ